MIFLEILPVVNHVCCIPNAWKHTNLWHGFIPHELGDLQLERLIPWKPNPIKEVHGFAWIF